MPYLKESCSDVGQFVGHRDLFFVGTGHQILHGRGIFVGLKNQILP